MNSNGSVLLIQEGADGAAAHPEEPALLQSDRDEMDHFANWLAVSWGSDYSLTSHDILHNKGQID